MIEIDGDHDGRLLCDEPRCPIGVAAIGADRWAVTDTLVEIALAGGWTITSTTGRDDLHYCPFHDPLSHRWADLWTTADVAAWCGVTTSTIRAYVVRGEMPAPSRVGRTMVWEPETITSWRPGGGRRG